MSSEETFDVFLSHSHVDAELVCQLAEQLEDEAHLHVWLDRWILVPGENWMPAMAKGLDRAACCVVCIGEQTPSGWFHQEIQRALNRQTQDPSFRVIPLLLPNAQTVNVDGFLELRTWVDFRGGLENEQAFHVLESGIRGEPPGRGPRQDDVLREPAHLQVREKLVQLRELHREKLLDDDILIEYQRKLLDRLVEV